MRTELDRLIKKEQKLIKMLASVRQQRKDLEPIRPRRPTYIVRWGMGETVLDMIKQEPGASRRDIISKLGAKGNRSFEMSISNALTKLYNKSFIARSDHKYYPGMNADLFKWKRIGGGPLGPSGNF